MRVQRGMEPTMPAPGDDDGLSATMKRPLIRGDQHVEDPDATLVRLRVIQNSQEFGALLSRVNPSMDIPATQVPVESSSSRAVGNFMIQSIGRLYGYVVALFSVTITLWLMSPQIYGEYSTLLIYLSFFGILADGGISAISTREAAKYPEMLSKVLTSTLILKILFAAAAYGTGILILYLFMPYTPDVKQAGLMLSSAMFISTSTTAFDIVFWIRQQPRYLTLTEITQRNILFLGIIGAFALMQFWHLISLSQTQIFYYLIILNVLVHASPLFIKTWGIVREKALVFQFDHALSRYILLLSFPVGIVAILGQIHYRVDAVILSILKPTGTDVVTYNVAYRVLELVMIFLTLLASILFPIMAESSKRQYTVFQATVRRTLNICVIAVLPISALLCLLAPGIVYLLGSGKYQASALPLGILAISVLFTFFNTVYSNLAIIENRQRRLIWAMVINIIANVTLNLLVIPRFSYNGSAFATVVTECLGMLQTIFIANRTLKALPSLTAIGKALVAIGVMSAIILLGQRVMPIHNMDLLTMTMGVLGSLGYIVTIAMLRGIDPVLVQGLRRRIRLPQRLVTLLAPPEKVVTLTLGSETVSVIVLPSPDDQRVAETLASAMTQSLPPSEILLVEGGAYSDLGELQRDYPALRLIPAADINMGLANAAAAAKGRYLYFVRAGDILEPRALEQCVAMLRTSPQCALLFGQAVQRDMHYHVKQFFRPPYRRHAGVRDGQRDAAQLARHDFMPLGTVLVNRDVFIGLLRAIAPQPRSISLRDFWRQAAAQSPIAYLPEILLEIRDISGDSVPGDELAQSTL